MTGIDVAEELARLPAQPLAALAVLRLAEDPEASPADLGRLVETDPALCARVMRLANSHRSGAHGPIRSASRAVLQLGFQTVKGVAAAAATSLLADDVDLGPVDQWVHSVAVASGASAAAALVGVPEHEAFSAGLLHDVGALVLHRADPRTFARVRSEAAGGTATSLAEAERAAFGTSHADAGADALEIWEFPGSFVDAVRRHHDPVATLRPLGQAVVLGEAVAAAVEPVDVGEPQPSLEATLEALGIPRGSARMLVAGARDATSEVAGFLGGSR
ncbi:MAG: HDOD domain-containing protein [Actinomycetota bacterium]|nr:HDOD domain-containing protein [Actinomycetota bacterium]